MEPTQDRHLGLAMSYRGGGASNRNRISEFNPNDADRTQEIDNSTMALNQSSYGPGVVEDISMVGPTNAKKKRQEIIGNPHLVTPNHVGGSHLMTPNHNQNDTSLNLSFTGVQPYQPYAFGENSGLPPVSNRGNANSSYNGQLDDTLKPFGLGLSPVQNSADLGPKPSPSPPKRLPRGGVAQGRPVATTEAGNVFSPNLSGMDKLALLTSIFVKQKFEMLEMLTGCETENRYKVYAAGQGLERVGRPIFKCKEKSSFMARNLLSGDCRPFQMKIIHEDREEDDEEDDMCLLLDRPCRCTVCCMNRPEITVTLKEGGANKYIGKVVSDWACCDMLFTVFDQNDRVIYKIYGDSCQWGLYCNCPCDSCAKIVFNIQSPLGEPLGEIYKIYSGAVKEFLTDTDNFCCVFPDGCPPEHKAILLAVVLFIDFRYFEQSPAQNNGLV